MTTLTTNDITATDLRRQLRDALKNVENNGATIRITRHGKTVAVLSPAPKEAVTLVPAVDANGSPV